MAHHHDGPHWPCRVVVAGVIASTHRRCFGVLFHSNGGCAVATAKDHSQGCGQSATFIADPNLLLNRMAAHTSHHITSSWCGGRHSFAKHCKNAPSLMLIAPHVNYVRIKSRLTRAPFVMCI